MRRKRRESIPLNEVSESDCLSIRHSRFEVPDSAREITRDLFSNGLEKDGVVYVSKKPKSDLED